MRAFVALDLDAASRDALARAAEAVRAAAPPTWRASWVSPSAMHVTVQFLGEIDEAIVPALGDALAAVMTPAPAPPPAAVALTAFPSEARARVLVAELGDPSGVFARIAVAVAGSLAAHGFTREARAYRPHVTLARLRVPRDVRPLVERVSLASLVLRVASLTLFRSDPGAGAPVYTALASARVASLPARS